MPVLSLKKCEITGWIYITYCVSISWLFVVINWESPNPQKKDWWEDRQAESKKDVWPFPSHVFDVGWSKRTCRITVSIHVNSFGLCRQADKYMVAKSLPNCIWKRAEYMWIISISQIRRKIILIPKSFPAQLSLLLYQQVFFFDFWTLTQMDFFT